MLGVGVMLADGMVAGMISADDSLAVGQKSPRVPPRIAKNEQIGGNFPLNRKKSALQGELLNCTQQIGHENLGPPILWTVFWGKIPLNCTQQIGHG